MRVNSEQNAVTVENEFGNRLSRLIDFLIIHEEPVKTHLAERLDIPPTTLSVWLGGRQRSIRKGHDKLAQVMRCYETSLIKYLAGELPFEELVQERESDSPLKRVLRLAENLSYNEQLQLNLELANRLLKKESETETAPLFSQPPESPNQQRDYIKLGWGDRRRFKRYLEEVKNLKNWETEDFVEAAMGCRATEADARSIHGDILTEDPERVYSMQEINSILPILPKIKRWHGDRPILDKEKKWSSALELIECIQIVCRTTQGSKTR